MKNKETIMQKTFGGICLIAGTAIGSGMLALPMILASFGVFYSIVLLLGMWCLTYYTSLVSVELSLQAKKGLSLGELGKLYSGRTASFIGIFSIKLISYALIVVFIDGGASVIHKMLEHYYQCGVSIHMVSVWYTCITMFIFALPLGIVEHVNRLLFYFMLTVIAFVICALFVMIDWRDMPLNGSLLAFDKICLALPIILTAFSFQTILPYLVEYCEKNSKSLKVVCFWGSLVPAIVYVLWVVVVLVVIYNYDKGFYQMMSQGQADLGSLIFKFSTIAKVDAMQLVIWSLSILAIVTSLIGVGIGLIDVWKGILTKNRKESFQLKILSIFLTFLPPLMVALLMKNAFLKILSFVGMVAVVIAVLLPLYLLQKAKFTTFYYPILRFHLLRAIAAIIGLLIVYMEILNHKEYFISLLNL